MVTKILAICLATAGISNFPQMATVYKIGDNSVTQEISVNELHNYVNDKWEWSIEPTVLMYTADGRSSYICESEVDVYKCVGWSVNPPVTIYSSTESKTVLEEEAESYLSTGVWFRTKEQARPLVATTNIFAKTNIPPEQLESVLSGGLSGYGQAFYDMEQTFGINSIFAISVAELESGHGTSYAFRAKNNAFGLGPGMTFSSVESGIAYFGKLMNSKLYYGKSIEQIGRVYCDSQWSGMVKSLMNENLRPFK